ncbi:MAG: hypothetical protein GXO54_01050 [Chloroflexi bacterium]|nr:hypothetical protein [Chloroflexota bacterium]
MFRGKHSLWWILLLILLVILVLTWWLPTLLVGLLPHEMAFVLGLLGFFLLGQGYIWELGWTAWLLRAWRSERLGQDEAQTRLADRVGAPGLLWLALWQAWQQSMLPRRLLFYSLVGFTGLLLLVFHLVPVIPASFLSVWTGFFFGAVTIAFLTWALEEAIADMAEDTLLAEPPKEAESQAAA